MRIMSRLLVLSLAILALPALALDYRVLAAAAVMYDAPSQKAKPLFVIARHTPVEVVVALESWLKVRDAAGELAWIEKRHVATDNKRMLRVTVPLAQVRVQPETSAALAFEAEKDVVLELIEAAPPGWAKVSHRDGQSGFVRVNQVWGL